MNGPDISLELTIEEMRRILDRNRYSMRMLSDRISLLTLENVELMSIAQEQQRDLLELRQTLSEVSSNGAADHQFRPVQD
jgi:hypothetical protein